MCFSKPIDDYFIHPEQVIGFAIKKELFLKNLFDALYFTNFNVCVVSSSTVSSFSYAPFKPAVVQRC